MLGFASQSPCPFPRAQKARARLWAAPTTSENGSARLEHTRETLGVSLTLPSCGQSINARICFAKSREDASEGSDGVVPYAEPPESKGQLGKRLAFPLQLFLAGENRGTPCVPSTTFPCGREAARICSAKSEKFARPHLLRKSEGRRRKSKAKA